MVVREDDRRQQRPASTAATRGWGRGSTKGQGDAVDVRPAVAAAAGTGARGAGLRRVPTTTTPTASRPARRGARTAATAAAAPPPPPPLLLA